MYLLVTPESVTIVLPLPPAVLSPNSKVASWGGRFLQAAATRKQRCLARVAVESECIETAPWPKVVLKATFFWKQKRRRDPNNAMGALKAAEDGIVDAGLVVDDDYEHMMRLPPVFELDSKNPRVILTITRYE